MPLNFSSNLRRFGLALMAPALFWACERRSIVTVDVATVEVSPSTLSIPPGGTGQLTARVLDQNGDVLPGRTVSWSSDDGSVASVNQSGLVSAVGNGSAQVTATAGGVQGAASVSVGTTGAIQLSLEEVMFETEEGGGVAPVNVAVTNGGSGSLTNVQFSVDYGGATSGWLSPSLNQNVTPATLSVATNAGVVSGLGPGQYSATVLVSANNAGNSPVSLPVLLTISTPDPAIGLNHSSRAFVITEGASSAPSQDVAVTNVGGGSLTGLARTVQYGSGASGWLGASLNRTSAPATLTLSLNSSVAGLGVGVYTANVRVTSGVATNSPQTVSVSLTVGDAPAAIGLDSSSVSFQAVEGVDPAGKSVGVTNLGGGSLTGITVSDNATWLTATRQSGTAPTDIDLAVDVDGLAPGDYNAVVSVASPVASNSPRTFDVSLEVVAKPQIVLSQNNVAFAAPQGGADPAPVDVGVTNGGEAPLTGLAANVASYGAGQPTGWLSAAINGPTTAPTNVRLTPTVTGLTEGVYTAIVEVTSSFPGVRRDTIDVTLTVSAPALIQLDQSSISFNTQAGSSPSNQSVQITNGNGSPSDLTGLGISIAYSGAAGQTWLNTSSLNKTTANANLTLRVSSASLAPGSYSATVSVTSPVAGNSPQDISVDLTVTAVPSISLSRTTVPFSTLQGASPANETVSVTNGGTGTLSGLGISIEYNGGGGQTWLNTSSLGSTTAPATLTLRVASGALAPGNYSATVSVESAVAENSPQDISVTLTVTAVPSISLSRTSVSFSAQAGTSPPNETVGVTNGGTGTLNGLGISIDYDGGGGQTWLNTSSLGSTTAPATLTLRVASGSLPPGNYSATVSVESGVADNSPQDITVMLEVTPVPSISLSRTSVSFSATAGSSPANETVEVTNGGTGTLNGLGISINYGGGGGQTWLDASSFDGDTEAPATLTLRVASDALAAGDYSATVSVESAVAANTPQDVAVTLTISPPSLDAFGLVPLETAETGSTVATGSGGAAGGAAGVIVSATANQAETNAGDEADSASVFVS